MKTPTTFAVALIAAALSTGGLVRPAAAQDARFRTYGPVTINGTTLPYRVPSAEAASTPGAPFAGDFIPIGKIDYRSIGPYAGLDPAEVWRRFSFLRRRGFRIDWLAYEAVVRLAGARPGELYAEDVLQKQIGAERATLPNLIANFVRSHRTGPGGAFIAEPIVFEVANEPNVFPYMTPDLYAWYYLSWRREVLAAVADFNRARPPADRVTAHLMPAGLWIFEGLPEPVLKSLRTSARIGSIELLRPVETDTRRYYEAFLAGVTSERYAALGSGTYQTRTVSVRIPFLGTYSYPVRTFVPAATQDLIDVGALHFYPYIARHAAWGEGNLGPHLANLRALADRVAASAKTRRVRLTEFGNVNPFDDGRTAREVVTPIAAHLKGGGVPALDCWYWFKGQGDDSKFKALDSVQGGVGGAIATGLKAIRLVNSIPLLPNVTVSHALTPADLQVLDDLTADYRRQTPTQGLKDDAGNPRQVGFTYLQFAN